MKKVLIALLVLLLIIGIALFVFAGKLDGIVKEVIETEGSAALGSAVRVSSVVTDLKAGNATINNFTIANPAGYSAKNAIEVTSFSASVDYRNQIIEEIDINQPIINAEQKGKKNNFQDLLNNIPDSAEEQTTEDEADTTVITINRLALRRATVNLITSDLSIADQTIDLGDRSFVMDDFVMNKLQGTSSEISDQLVKALTAHVSSQVSAYLKQEIGKMAKAKVLDEAKDKIKEKLDGKIGEKLKGFKFKLGKD